MGIDTVRRQRGLPFLKRGMRVESLYDGKLGRITGANRSGNINVLFDGEKISVNCHPTWMMRYFNSENDIIMEFKE